LRLLWQWGFTLAILGLGDGGDQEHAAKDGDDERESECLRHLGCRQLNARLVVTHHPWLAAVAIGEAQVTQLGVGLVQTLLGVLQLCLELLSALLVVGARRLVEVIQSVHATYLVNFLLEFLLLSFQNFFIVDIIIVFIKSVLKLLFFF
jgi:hypothetical protein